MKVAVATPCAFSRLVHKTGKPAVQENSTSETPAASRTGGADQAAGGLAAIQQFAHALQDALAFTVIDREGNPLFEPEIILDIDHAQDGGDDEHHHAHPGDQSGQFKDAEQAGDEQGIDQGCDGDEHHSDDEYFFPEPVWMVMASSMESAHSEQGLKPSTSAIKAVLTPRDRLERST